MAGTSSSDRLPGGLLEGTPLDPDHLPALVDLPTWADPERLRSLAVVGIVVAVALLVLAARLVRRLVVRTVVVVVLAALAIGLWDQRAELGDCVATCDCSLFGQVVEVPFDLNPRCA